MTRRSASRQEEQRTSEKFVQVAEGWWNVIELQQVANTLVKEQCLRHKYPALNELWQQYHMMIALVSHD